MTTTKPTRERNKRVSVPADVETPLHVELAAAAVLEEWTRDQVIEMIISRISRDRRYLAYRKACNRRTSYDDQVQQDMQALAIAICWLQEQPVTPAPLHHSALPYGESGHRGATGQRSSNANECAKVLVAAALGSQVPSVVA